MPRVAVFAGINGAGKSTASRRILADVLRIKTFVNADTIARGLSELDPESQALAAGRVMLAHLHDLAARRADFAFETTLAARTYAGWLAGLRDSGYDVLMYYFWLDSPDRAIDRVAARVRAGGHHIPDATVRQRYGRSIRNFFELYRPVCAGWRFYDNSGTGSRMIAIGDADEEDVYDAETWARVQESAGHE